MSISRQEVLRIAELARLEIPEDQLDQVALQLSQVLDFAAALDRLDLKGCDPSTFAPPDAPLREDATGERRLEPETALAGASDREGRFFLVPPVVENLNP